MPLPENWVRHKDQDLELYLERGGLTDDEVHDVITELALRDADRQARADTPMIEYPLEWIEGT